MKTVKVITGHAFALAIVLLSAAAQAADSKYAREWGPKVGTSMPAINAVDHAGETQTLETLKGENGLLVFFNRSADW